MGIVGLLPDPLHPALGILSKRPSRFPSQETEHQGPGLGIGRDDRQFDDHRRVGVAPGHRDGIQDRPRTRTPLAAGLKEQVQRRCLSPFLDRLGAGLRGGQRRTCDNQCRKTRREYSDSQDRRHEASVCCRHVWPNLCFEADSNVVDTAGVRTPFRGPEAP